MLEFTSSNRAFPGGFLQEWWHCNFPGVGSYNPSTVAASLGLSKGL